MTTSERGLATYLVENGPTAIPDAPKNARVPDRALGVITLNPSGSSGAGFSPSGPVIGIYYHEDIHDDKQVIQAFMNANADLPSRVKLRSLFAVLVSSYNMDASAVQEVLRERYPDGAWSDAFPGGEHSSTTKTPLSTYLERASTVEDAAAEYTSNS